MAVYGPGGGCGDDGKVLLVLVTGGGFTVQWGRGAGVVMMVNSLLVFLTGGGFTVQGVSVVMMVNSVAGVCDWWRFYGPGGGGLEMRCVSSW